ncbi:uncharacterized protein B0H64DRAFT_123262 [Chaetomium fimeti]|uniref:Uncharacterized protein n=1 Tax=Chaetomium fimeti TaxID=1854472 RepID=A0AAE0HJD7_9PEZI|nr:hypothetical protein B0H64DRAFT_123262 [Chaetomium fimeti]
MPLDTKLVICSTTAATWCINSGTAHCLLSGSLGANRCRDISRLKCVLPTRRNKRRAYSLTWGRLIPWFRQKFAGGVWFRYFSTVSAFRACNGTHTCLVTAPARCSLSDNKQASTCGFFQLSVLDLLPLNSPSRLPTYVHEQGLVHGGT